MQTFAATSTSTSSTTTFLFFVALCSFIATTCQALQPVVPPSTLSSSRLSSSTNKLSPALYYSNGAGSIVAEPPVKTIKIRTIAVEQDEDQDDVEVNPLCGMVDSLYDPSVRFKVRRRFRKSIADVDREKKLKKHEIKAKAKSNFEEGQQAAMSAIQEVLDLHNIDTEPILP
ncbi:hypothetical protein ACA910_019501 [Epithemia clementina (nom. ined.)]